MALIVGGGPGISASCERLFSRQGLKVAVAARNVDKPVLQALARDHGVSLVACDASVPESVAAMFEEVSRTLGSQCCAAGCLWVTNGQSSPASNLR